jgi:hypothetical protein
MSQRLFDEDEFQEKKVKVQDIEDQNSLIDRLKLSGLPDITPDLDISFGPVSTPDVQRRKLTVVIIEVFLITYLGLGYAGLVPLF